jgi:hypothetical protein
MGGSEGEYPVTLPSLLESVFWVSFGVAVDANDRAKEALRALFRKRCAARRFGRVR